MGERRNVRRRSRGDGVEDERELAHLTKSEDEGADAERMDEETMASGRASDVEADEGDGSGGGAAGGRKGGGKRGRRDVASSKAGVTATAAHRFFRETLLALISNPLCDEFLRPVLETYAEEEVPGYREKIRHPMDLGTLRDRLAAGMYAREVHGGWVFDGEACANDLRLVFENCILYNEPTSELHRVAHELLQSTDERIAKWEAEAARERERAKKQDSAAKKAKRDHERKRRKLAEEEAATAAAQAKRAALQVEKMKQEAAEAARRREMETRRKESALRVQMEREKERAVSEAVQEALNKARREGRGRQVNTSSVSSDEHEQGVGEIAFMFVSTEGMEKKRGRKSAVVMELEGRHDECTKRRRTIIDSSAELERMKQVEMTEAEKQAVCERVAELDFVRMKAVADIIARGMQRPDILNAVEIDIDVANIDNWVMREVQFFLNSPVVSTARNALKEIEDEITGIETKLVDIRYYQIDSSTKR